MVDTISGILVIGVLSRGGPCSRICADIRRFARSVPLIRNHFLDSNRFVL